MSSLATSYLGLCKLKVVALIVFTAMVGMFMATSPPGMVPWDVLLFGNLGMASAWRHPQLPRSTTCSMRAKMQKWRAPVIARCRKARSAAARP